MLSAKPSSTTRYIVALSPHYSKGKRYGCVPSTRRRAPASLQPLPINPSGLAELPLTLLFLFDQESGHPISRAVFLAGKDRIGDCDVFACLEVEHAHQNEIRSTCKGIFEPRRGMDGSRRQHFVRNPRPFQLDRKSVV